MLRLIYSTPTANTESVHPDGQPTHSSVRSAIRQAPAPDYFSADWTTFVSVLRESRILPIQEIPFAEEANVLFALPAETASAVPHTCRDYSGQKLFAIKFADRQEGSIFLCRQLSGKHTAKDTDFY